MTRTFKLLGLVLTAALTLSLASASAASAVELEVEGEKELYPETITGSLPETAPLLKFTFEDGLVFECKSITFDATLTGPTSTLTASTSYGECVLTPGPIGGTIDMKGCDYMYHLGATTEPDTAKATVDLECPTGDGPTITAGTCKILIEPNQTGLGSATFIDDTNGHVTLKPEISGIKYVKEQDGFACPMTGTGTKEDGGQSGHITLFGEHKPIGLID